MCTSAHSTCTDTTQVRISAVLRVLAGQLSSSRAAEELGVDVAQIDRWVRGLSECCQRCLRQGARI